MPYDEKSYHTIDCILTVLLASLTAFGYNISLERVFQK